MMRELILITFLGLAVATGNRNHRIVGGSETEISRYPSMAAILTIVDFINFNQICGGTIINNRSILSAAHCFGLSVTRYRARIGSTYANSGGVVHNTDQIIYYTGNTTGAVNGTFENDIAIWRSATAFTYTENVRPASIAGPNYIPADNDQVTAIGWGYINNAGPPSEHLLYVDLKVINHDLCKEIYDNNVWVNQKVIDAELCVGSLEIDNIGVCSGDSGGPVFHNNVQVGIVSWSYFCGDRRYPTVTAKVSSYTSWIQSNA